MLPAYYNEIDPYAAQWLRNLIAAGHLPAGDVDTRSIVDVRADDLAGYGQCHFFAGIGGWALALRIAGISDDSLVWTGSPPCQDNSVAAAVTGRRTGLDGERSGLARHWLALVSAICPGVVMFENVPGIRPWLHHITEGLGRIGYRVSESERSSQGVGADHPRRRVWVVADSCGAGLAVTRKAGARQKIDDPRAAAPGDYWVATERGFRPLDDGFPERVAQVRAFGNAIDPWVAAQVVADHFTDLRLEKAA